MTDSPISLSQAQTDASTAQSNYDTAITNYDTALNGPSGLLTSFYSDLNSHYTTMDGLIDTANSAFNTIVTGIRNLLTPVLDGFETALESTLDGPGGLTDVFDGAMSLADGNLQTANQSASDGYQVTRTGLDSTLAGAMTAAANGYSATDTIQRGIRDGVITAEDTDLNTDITAEDATFNGVQTFELNQLDTLEDGYWSAYETAISDTPGNAGWIRNNAVTGYEATRDGVITANPSVSLDPAAVFQDPSFQSTLAGINAATQSVLDGFAATYEANLQTHLDNFNNAVNGPGGHLDTYNSLVAAADTAYDTAKTNADNTWTTNTNAAKTAYDNAVNGLGGYKAIFDAAMVTAQQDYDAAIDAAQAIYDSIMGPAEDAYEAAINAAILEYENFENGSTPGVTYQTDVWIVERYDTVLLTREYEMTYVRTSSDGGVVQWTMKGVDSSALAGAPALVSTNVSTVGSIVTTTQHFQSSEIPLSPPSDPDILAAVNALPSRNMYERAIQQAVMLFATTVDQLEDALAAAQPGLDAIYNAAVTAANLAYDTQRLGTISLPGFEPVYFDALSNASDTFSGAEQGFLTTFDSTLIGLQPMYDAAMQLMMTDPVNGMIAMQAYDNAVNQAKKDYFVDVAAASVTQTNDSWGAYVSYVTSERAADTTRDQAIINAEWQRADMMLDNTHAAVSGEIDAAGTLATAVIQIAASYAIDGMSKYLKMVGDIGTATRNIELTEHGAAETFRISTNAAERQYQYDGAAALETFSNQEVGAAQILHQAYATEDETWNNSMADADRDWIQSESTAATLFTQSVTTERQILTANEMGEYVSYVGNVAGEVINWASNVGSAFVTFATAGSSDPGLAAVANAWEQFWNDAAAADQAYANAAASAFQIYGNQTAAAEKAAEDTIAAADETRRDNIADDSVDYVTNVAAAERAYEFAMSGAMVTQVSQEAAAEREFIEDDADAVKLRDDALVSATRIHADAATNAADQLLTSAIPAARANFTSVTNATAVADQNIVSAEVDLMHAVANAGHQRDKDDLLSAQLAALGLASADDPLYVAFAELLKANEVLDAVLGFVALQAQPLADFFSMFVGSGSTSTTMGPPTYVTPPPMPPTSSGDLIDKADAFFAGWAGTLTFGGTTKVREWIYGETATRNHQGTAFNIGVGVGSVHSLAMGWGGGTGACVKGGQWAKSAMSAYTTIGTGVGIANSAHNIATGNASWMDALPFAPALGRAAGPVLQRLGILRYQCFVGDTPVVIREAENIAVARMTSSEPDRQAGANLAWVVMAAIAIPIGVIGKQKLEQRDERQHQLPRGKRLLTYDLDDPNRLELPSGPPNPDTEDVLPHLSPVEFDELCDRLLSGGDIDPREESRAQRGSHTSSSARRGSPDPAATLTEGLKSDVQSSSRTSTALLDTPDTETPMFAISKPSVTTRTTKRSARSKLGMAWMWGCLLLAGGFLWQGFSGTSHSSRPLIAASTPRPAPSVTKYETKPIRDIRVGERVLARNPQVSEAERADAIEPDPATWRQIELTMLKDDGGSLAITLLRSTDWLQQHAEDLLDFAQPGWFVLDQRLQSGETLDRALVNQTIELDLPELGAAGPALITAIEPCPAIEPNTNDGRQVVTATFRHSSGDVLDLHIHGEPKPIGTTANHPFWSEDRQAFIPAGELTEGEHLRRADETITQVTHITPRHGPPVPVYNLEINAEHVYFVGQNGELTHNNYVYIGAGPGGRYVGITNNMMRRASEHAAMGRYVQRINVSGLTRMQARGVEQALINHFGLGQLANIRNSISPSNVRYSTAVAEGQRLLRAIGFPGF